ncbi:hypothetical protein A0256_00755 [Mucilaginibacter sp. PAMC 26640]|nr:hypothetical protein A0256_00755 [Mucilaginibacter sp. PAMC 26640]
MHVGTYESNAPDVIVYILFIMVKSLELTSKYNPISHRPFIMFLSILKQQIGLRLERQFADILRYINRKKNLQVKF